MSNPKGRLPPPAPPPKTGRLPPAVPPPAKSSPAIPAAKSVPAIRRIESAPAMPAAPSAPAMPPMPTPEGFMSTEAKMSLIDVALALRDEQLQARIVQYKAELDAVTEQVIEELESLRAAARNAQAAEAPHGDRAQLEIELIQTLKEMLGRVFRPGKLATVMERKLGEVSKRFARTFFSSELHERIRGSDDEVKAMRYPEQALYHAFARVQHDLLGNLDALQYASPEVRLRAEELFSQMIKELRNGFLARTTPELNELIRYLNDVLTAFFTEELPPLLGELAWEVVKEARLADARTVAGYKISAATFPVFRQAFELRFMRRLVPFVEDEMLARVREHARDFRAETLRLVADPTIFSDVLEVACDAVYDMLYNDGFLDLPSDWRARLAGG